MVGDGQFRNDLYYRLNVFPVVLPPLEDAEREHIVSALREARWVLGGPNGAAARLAMKRTTLQSKMKRLGISRPT
jgi:transcriptional regulator with GAF, ATPase, and Fis domain